MSKFQEYLRNKKIKEMGLPSMFLVKSDRSGVSKPIKLQVVDFEEKPTWMMCGSSQEKTWLDKYIVEYNSDVVNDREIFIAEGKTSEKKDYYGSGFGDLWGYTYFYTIDESEANEFHLEESKRVNDKYLNPIKLVNELSGILEFLESTNHLDGCGSFERNPPNLAWVHGEYLKCDCRLENAIEKIKSIINNEKISNINL